ncbi:hypothetical protein C8R46DRAFT_1346786 [Mycena filopes]|nr:hypothetical protein C8R46DRAFT_1346786 [Mycena filopes]
MSQIPSPVLPLELEQEIFETSAILFPELIPSLLLVSHRTREWIERIKYRTVTPHGEHSTCRFRDLQRAIQSNTRPPSFFRAHVRHLVVPFFFIRDETAEIVQNLLAACAGVQHLTFTIRLSPSYLPALARLRPHRLVITLDPLLVGTDSVVFRPLFTYVTHLSLYRMSGIFDTSAWLSFLNSLPSLTHLLLSDLFEMVAPILATCKSLQVLIDFDHSPAAPELDDAGGDDRFVYMKIRSGLDEWLKGTRGEVDHWARAEMFIAKKRRGEIKPKTRCWIEATDGV